MASGSLSPSARHGSLPVQAPIMEVFASFQGEGLYVGQPQVFLRLAGCPLRCRWCDTPGSWSVRPGAAARVERVEGEAAWGPAGASSDAQESLEGGHSAALAGRRTSREDRIASPFQAALWIASAEPGEPRVVSVTGGEPLVWPGFILALRPMIAPRRLHLETAGAHPEALAMVLDACDHISLDLKLPADMLEPVELEGELDAAGEEGRGDELNHGTGDGAGRLRPTTERAPRDADEWALARRRCLDLIRDRDACVKIVIGGDRTPRDFSDLFEDVARRAPNLPVFLAPATPVGGVPAPELSLLVDVAEDARDLGLDVRVLPQVHRAMGIA